MTDYKRFPVLINKNTVMVVHVFTRHDCLEDIWMYDCEHVHKQETNHTNEAKQFIDQLEGLCTPRFLMNLRDAITDKLSKEDYARDSNFSSVCSTCFRKYNTLCSNSFHVMETKND